MTRSVLEIEAKSVIVASKLPDADVVINPYVGCGFGCHYCYASFMGRLVNQPIDAWGTYVYAKANAVEVIDKELATMGEAKRQRRLLLSSVTDPYQGAELRYRLTRGILDRLVAHHYPGPVGVLTKSPLVARDLDLLSQLPIVEVGMTITTTDDGISRWLEGSAPRASRRLQALAEVRAAGLKTYAFVGPLLPHYADQPDLLDELFERLADTGVQEIYVEHLNTKQYIRKRLDAVLASEPEAVQGAYQRAQDAAQRARLEEIVRKLMDHHGLRLRLDGVLNHDSPPTNAQPMRTAKGIPHDLA